MPKELIRTDADGQRHWRITSRRGATLRYETDNARQERFNRAAKIAVAAIAAGLICHAVITGQPINDGCGELHGQSRIACARQAGENTKAGYAHRGIVTSPMNDDDLQQQDARY